MNAIIRIAVAAAMMLVITSPIKADGNDLLLRCVAAERFIESGDQQITQPTLALDIGYCLGLVQGVRNTMQLIPDGWVKACFPESGITNGQAIRIVVSYLKRNPEHLHQKESVLTMLAFVEAYPCE